MYGNKVERPAHQVTLNSFYISKYPITQKQWHQITGSSFIQHRDNINAEFENNGEGDNYPMYYINWEEAQIFICLYPV